jgi:hypothetical protein
MCSSLRQVRLDVFHPTVANHRWQFLWKLARCTLQERDAAVFIEFGNRYAQKIDGDSPKWPLAEKFYTLLVKVSSQCAPMASIR